MKFISKRVKKVKSNFESKVIESLKPQIANLSQKYRFAGRIRLLNRWCIKNPKKFFFYVVAFFAFIVSVNLISDIIFISKSHKNENAMAANIVAVDSMFDGLHSIQANKETEQKHIEEYALLCKRLKSEIDSLNNTKNKSHQDSLEMYQKAKQIKIIINNLNPNYNEKD